MRTSIRTLCVALLAGLLTFTGAAWARTYETLFSDNVGRTPSATLIQGSDGNFYGTTAQGGASSVGTVFKVTPAGVRTTLTSFNGLNGSNPQAGLVVGSDSNFYGTTYQGGASNFGTVFKVTPAGVLTTLVSFNLTIGTNPRAGLVVGSDGNFYGTTQNNGASIYGTVFRMTPAGVLTTLVNFNYTNGANPYAGLVIGSDGNFYGTTYSGGASGSGTVFKMTPAGVLTTLMSFNTTNGRYPYAGLVSGSDGNFYGTTSEGGTSGGGTVFKMTSAGVLTTVVNFTPIFGMSPRSGVVEGSDGNFYGAIYGFTDGDYGKLYKVTTSGVLTTLVSFDYSTKGAKPLGGLVAGSDGQFYGTTSVGGAGGNGIVFKVTNAGVLTPLMSFKYLNGNSPYAGLTAGSDGNFYGTTSQAGPSSAGTVFRVTPTGVLTTVVSLDYSTKGGYPRAGLVAGSDGNFYGTTYSGGVSTFGTVFKMTPAGVFTVLASFNSANGSNPQAGLVVGSDGNFYGTAQSGGTDGYGTVFKVTPAGVLTRLVSFSEPNGSNPYGGLVVGSDGNFYGTTGGGFGGTGTVFKVTPAGVLTTLVRFDSTTGLYPYAGLTVGSDGNFYGTTYSDGESDHGTVFKVTPAGVLTTLHSFDGTTSANPRGTPIFGSDGNLYGTASGLAIWRISFDTTTLTPTLTAPAFSMVTSSPVNVSFSLPEAALAGSVKLSFGSTVLTLANSEGSAGAHAFTFNPASPTASAQVVSGAAVADGSYTVTLSYQDALGNPAASAVSTAVVVDTVAPTFSLPANITAVATSGAGAAVTYAASASDSGSGVATSNFAPASGSTFPFGTTTVNASATDHAGNAAAGSFTVTVLPPLPVRTVLGSKGAALPGAGVLGSGIPAGAVWATFGVPSVNEVGQAVVLGTFKVGAVSTTAILGFEVADLGTMKVVVKKGDAAPGIAGAVMSALTDPLLGPDGSVAWIATLSGAVTLADNVAIFLDADGAGAASAGVIARKGLIPAGTLAWKAFASVALGGNAVAFTAVLETKTAGVSPGPGGVTTLTDSGLWVYNRTNSTMALALREGNPLLGSTVKTIGALAARPGSPGQGRGLAYDGDQDYTVLRVTLGDARQALGYIGQDGTGDFSYVAGGDALGYGAGAKWQSFGLPTQNSGSAAMAFVGTVKALTGTATTLNNVAIFAEDDVNYEAARLVSKGDAAGVSGGVFSVFKDPVSAGGRAVAFLGTMKVVPGITAADNDGVWSFSEVSGLDLVAREGFPAAEAGGGVWKAFTSLALPEGRGPLFVASLINRTGTTLPALPGPGGITTANDMGLWATDSLGALRLLLQEGDAIGASTVKTFVVLSSVVGSPAQTRSFNSGGSVMVKATDALGAQYLLHLAVP